MDAVSGMEEVGLSITMPICREYAGIGTSVRSWILPFPANWQSPVHRAPARPGGIQLGIFGTLWSVCSLLQALQDLTGTSRDLCVNDVVNSTLL